METMGKPVTLNPRFGLMCSGEIPGFHRRGLNNYLYYFFGGGSYNLLSWATKPYILALTITYIILGVVSYNLSWAPKPYILITKAPT